MPFWKIDVICLGLSIMLVGVALGVMFPFSILLMVLSVALILSWPVGYVLSVGTMTMAIVSTLALQCGYFIGLLIRAILEDVRCAGAGAARIRSSPFSEASGRSPPARTADPGNPAHDV